MTFRPAIACSNFSGRTCLFIFIAFETAVLGWLLHADGRYRTWHRWDLPLLGSNFPDLRVITGAATSAKAGFDPLVENPYDKQHRPLNYPRIWLRLVGPGLSDGAIYSLAASWIAAFLLGLWWITKDLEKKEALYFGVLMWSPAMLLCVERGNTDLLMFFLLALAGLVAERSIASALAVVLPAFALKLYPLAGLTLLLREPRARALRLAGIAFSVAAVYLILNASDLAKIRAATEWGDLSSYGVNTLWMLVGHFSTGMGLAIRNFSYCAVVLSFTAAWLFSRRPVEVSLQVPGRKLDFYRVGAGVYIGTFLLGNNWDYRLIFLLFLVPQLFVWAHNGPVYLRRLALSQLAAIVSAMWAMCFTEWLLFLPHCYLYARTVEELSNWWLFMSTLCLFAATLPEWARMTKRPGAISAGIQRPGP